MHSISLMKSVILQNLTLELEKYINQEKQHKQKISSALTIISITLSLHKKVVQNLTETISNLKNIMSYHRNLAMSQSNMSDIKESIEEYSMNFQNSHDPQAISEMISVSKTGHNVSISRQSKNLPKKSFANIVDKQNEKFDIKKTEEKIVQEEVQKENPSGLKENNNVQNNDPVFLGDNVFKIIKERYRQVQGTQTADPDALYDFYKRQKKNYKPEKAVSKNLKIDDVGSLMPSSQRKMILKMQFQKILSYYPQDVYYTLACGAEKFKKDQQLESKTNKLNFYMSQRPQSQKKNAKQIVDRLYTVKRQVQIVKEDQNAQNEEIQKRRNFGTRLVEHFINHFKNNPDPPEPTAQKLYEFWQDSYEREEHGIQWEENKAQNDIKFYMMEQIQELLVYLQRKLGFKELSEPEIRRFYAKYEPINKVYIPPLYLKCFINAYNDVMKQKQNKRVELQSKRMSEAQKRKKQNELKKFGRPVSATPISILSKPKTTANFGSLIDKYAKDKFLSTILHEDKMKVARKAFEYGIYDMQQQVKTKGRVKPKNNENYEKTIFKLLNQTYTNKNFFNVKDEDRVRHILGEENIQKAENWKQFGPILQQAMLVRCYEQNWFRQALVKYCSRVGNKEYKYSDDKTVVNDLIKYLNGLGEQKRGDQIGNLDNIISTSQTIAERTKQIQQLSKKGKNVQMKEKRLFYSFLQQKACEFVDMRMKRKEFNLREFMNQIFQTAMKDHKQFVSKYFGVVTGDKECPKLLKYEFFRLQKEINPFTKQRDQKSKCHAWIPTKADPQNFNYRTFNAYSNAYKLDKNKIVSKQQDENHKNSIWGYKNEKAKEREALLMTYQDAKQCVFHPKISKMF